MDIACEVTTVLDYVQPLGYSISEKVQFGKNTTKLEFQLNRVCETIVTVASNCILW